MAENTDLSRLSPSEIDKVIATLDEQITKKEARLERLAIKGSSRQWPVRSREDEQNQLRDEIEGLKQERIPYSQEYIERGWSRYYHVTNANGHVHTSTSCSSCFPTTTYHWRTDLSGMTEQEVVDAEAYRACTICLPIAPAEQQAARKARTEAERAERRAAKELKEAEKLAKKKERARKLIEKYERLVPARLRYNLKETDSSTVYNMHLKYPAQVGNLLLDEAARARGETRTSMVGFNPYELVDNKEFVGVIDQKYEAELTVKSVTTYETEYEHDANLHIFEDAQGNVVKWRSTNGTKLEKGKTYTVNGRVKSHDDHPEYGKQTTLTHCTAKEK